MSPLDPAPSSGSLALDSIPTSCPEVPVEIPETIGLALESINIPEFPEARLVSTSRSRDRSYRELADLTEVANDWLTLASASEGLTESNPPN